MNQTLTQIQEELYKKYKGKRIPANEGNGNIVIGQEFLDDIFNFVSIRVIEKVNKEWLSINLRNDNKENWDKELSKFGLFMQELSTLIK